MKKEIEVFKNEKFGEIRTVEINDEIWFVGKDVAAALGYSDVNKAIAMHVDEEDKKLNDKTSPSFGQRGAALINESGLYLLILSSKLESAKEFKHWITSEVLPSIRKTGSYSVSHMSDKEIEVNEKEVGLARCNALRAIASEYSGNKTYKQILDAYATKELTGEFLLPLPETEKTYSAGEIGKMLGISAVRVGRIANENGMKTEKYGKLFVDKSRYSSKEVETFRYNEDGVAEIKRLFLNYAEAV